jgi:hypothetical protein
MVWSLLDTPLRVSLAAGCLSFQKSQLLLFLTFASDNCTLDQHLGAPADAFG